MCGIAGYINFNKADLAYEAVIKKMTDVIAYRGPDGEGFYIQDNLALGHRRLSIIDINNGNQPMYSSDKKKVIVFNGEIYNYIELRKELIGLGFNFKTNSDTEVVLKAYEYWGQDCQNKFNGMWAFAIWDDEQKELFLSRDRLGEKPLHYYISKDKFVFASEIKSIEAHGISLTPRLELLELYLTFSYIPAPHTFYNDVHKLLPGHSLLVKNGEFSIAKYWDIPQLSEQEMFTDQEYVYQKFEELFIDAVRIRMRSDVHFGAFLSGGLDSSAVVAAMSRNSKFPINTFTIGFKEKAFDESALAEEVSLKFKTHHHLGTVLPEEIEQLLEKAIHHFDEPFGDASAIPTHHVSKFAAQKVKMVLTGDGGDEVLSGYNAYIGIKLSQVLKKIPKPFRLLVIFLLNKLKIIFKNNYRYKINKTISIIETANLEFIQRIITKNANADISVIKRLTKKSVISICAKDFLENVMKECKFQDDFYKLMFFHYKMNLPNDYLVKVDRMSMANSIETRLPFLDYRLVEFMAKVHKNVKMNAWERKSILRNTLGKKLPENILKAPKKGFGIPLSDWFKNKDILEFVETKNIELFTILDENTFNNIIQKNTNGINDNGDFIWTILILTSLLKNEKSF
jgi:asparagine synthase (glutamine-hydrolysing)